DRVRAFACCFCRVRKCDHPRHSLGDVHVDRSHRADLVRLRLGDSTARDWLSLDLSLSTARWTAVSKVQAAHPGLLAFSLARVSPHWVLKFETAWNHFVELVVPWFSFGPRLARHIAGVLLVTFQIFLIISGNLSFLNYLTIIPFLACFDDSFLRHFLPRAIVRRAEHAAQQSQPSRINSAIAVVLSIMVIWLSIPTVLNLVSGRQLMNYSFDPRALVNTYGAFGTVGRERDEIIFEGTDDVLITDDTKRKEYEFRAQPGDLNAWTHRVPT